MNYELSDEVVELVIQMCDVVLKAGGLANKPSVDKVIKAFEPYIIKKGIEEKNKQMNKVIDKIE